MALGEREETHLQPMDMESEADNMGIDTDTVHRKDATVTGWTPAFPIHPAFGRAVPGEAPIYPTMEKAAAGTVAAPAAAAAPVAGTKDPAAAAAKSPVEAVQAALSGRSTSPATRPAKAAGRASAGGDGPSAKASWQQIFDDLCARPAAGKAAPAAAAAAAPVARAPDPTAAAKLPAAVAAKAPVTAVQAAPGKNSARPSRLPAEAAGQARTGGDAERAQAALPPHTMARKLICGVVPILQHRMKAGRGPVPVADLAGEFKALWNEPFDLQQAGERDVVQFLRKWPLRVEVVSDGAAGHVVRLPR